MRVHRITTVILAFFIVASAEVSIHIYNPWIENPYRQDSLYIVGMQEVGYHPGTKMVAEGNGWFYYMVKDSFFSNSSVSFRSYIGNQYDQWGQRLTFPDSFGIVLNRDLLNRFPGYNEFWIIPVDSINKFNVYVEPPEGKVIHIMNPWPNNSPQILIGANPARKMRVNTQICGWYTYFFSGFIDSLQKVYFTDYYHTSQYGQAGLSGGGPLDLSAHLLTSDTIYILPRPFPSGPPSISTTFPGRTGECPTRKVSALVRDWKADGVSFFTGGITGSKVTKGMVQNQLGPNGKPLKGAAADNAYGSMLETWFTTVDNNEICIDLTLTKGYDGRWEYDSDLFGGFFPIDDFNHPNNVKYEDANKKLRNFLFTMEMHLQFQYRQGTGQEFVFRGDDDVWIFVNNRLAIDLGGMHPRESDTLVMDDLAASLGLVNGNYYAMDIFFAERQPVHSNFLVRTSLDLRNSEDLYAIETVLGPGKIQYDIMQRVGLEGLDCGFTPLLDTSEPAIVDFFLEGPQFQDSSVRLPPGLNYGGIMVATNPSIVTIDSVEIEGLAAGSYTITFVSSLNNERSGYLTFLVGGKSPAILSANPPGGTHFFKDTMVHLYTNDDAQIYYTTDGSEPDTNNPLQIYSGPISLQHSTTIRAIATGDAYIPTSGSWIYTRDAIAANLTADPPDGTHFFEDTIITLSAIPDARIYYTTDGSNPDTGNPEHLYVTPFTISNTATVKAIAVGDYIASESGMWSYTRDLPDAMLEADPGNNTHFGEQLEITLITDAEEIYFTIDGSDPVPGSPNQLYTGPFIITDDTVVVKAIAIGTEHNSTSKQWKYISDRIPGVVANPPGCEFSEPITVSLWVNDPDATIYYTLDGSEPTISSLLYQGPLVFSTTTQIRARAFADNKVPSAILTETYTRSSLALSAFYYDRNADGSIDSFWVKLDYQATTVPESLILINPTYNEKIVLLDNQLQLSSDGLSISASLNPPLHYDNNTGFSPRNNARFGGRKFGNDFFIVEDKVAPVLSSVTLAPNLLSDDDEITDIGILTVIFSEDIGTINGNQPLFFSQNGTEYTLELQLRNQTGKQAVFNIRSIAGVDFPRNGDLVWISPYQGITDIYNNIQNNPENLRIPMKVLPQPYVLIFKAGPNPFIPGVSTSSQKVEGLTITTGITIVADFRGDLKSEASKVKAKISIYDGLGNLLCSANEAGSSSSPVQYGVTTEAKTKVVFKWNGYTSKGRKVGSGVYVAMISVTDPSGVTTTEKMLIGVKHP